MAGFPIEPARRIKTLPPYLFAAIDEMKQKAIAKGVDIINLGIGDPDLPTPMPIVEKMRQAVANPKHHQYPSYEGMLAFRQAVADPENQKDWSGSCTWACLHRSRCLHREFLDKAHEPA